MGGQPFDGLVMIAKPLTSKRGSGAFHFVTANKKARIGRALG
jgi:hypothetical protein